MITFICFDSNGNDTADAMYKESWIFQICLYPFTYCATELLHWSLVGNHQFLPQVTIIVMLCRLVWAYWAG
jgi:hypothetical protein